MHKYFGTNFIEQSLMMKHMEGCIISLEIIKQMVYQCLLERNKNIVRVVDNEC